MEECPLRGSDISGRSVPSMRTRTRTPSRIGSMCTSLAPARTAAERICCTAATAPSSSPASRLTSSSTDSSETNFSSASSVTTWLHSSAILSRNWLSAATTTSRRSPWARIRRSSSATTSTGSATATRRTPSRTVSGRTTCCTAMLCGIRRATPGSMICRSRSTTCRPCMSARAAATAPSVTRPPSTSTRPRRRRTVRPSRAWASRAASSCCGVITPQPTNVSPSFLRAIVRPLLPGCSSASGGAGLSRTGGGGGGEGWWGVGWECRGVRTPVSPRRG